MKVNKIELAWITVSDIKKAEEFFNKTLGLNIIAKADEYGWLELQASDGGTFLGVAQQNEEDVEQSGHNAILTMTVDDILEAKKELESKNVEFIGDILEVPGHVKMATFVDVDGNMFQLVQKLS